MFPAIKTFSRSTLSDKYPPASLPNILDKPTTLTTDAPTIGDIPFQPDTRLGEHAKFEPSYFQKV